MPFQVRVNVSQKWDAQIRAAYAFGAEGHSGRGARSAGMAEAASVLVRRNEQRADVLRARAAQMVQDSIGTKSGRWASERRAQSTGLLAKATGSRRNTFATVAAVGIGNEAWLDQQTARLGRYWRSFEEGYSGHVGNQLRMPGRFNIGGRWTTLKPLPATRGRSYDPSIRTVPWGPVVIRRPIEAHRVYAELFRAELPRLRRDTLANAQDYLRALTSTR